MEFPEEQNRDVKVKSLEAIFLALREAQARYLVVGGLAVIAHGYVRLTKDLDLALDLSPEALPRALRAFESLGYRPIAPVPLTDFANPILRHEWTEDKQMKVFNLVSDRHPDVSIDIFPKDPFSFEAEYAEAVWKQITPKVTAPMVSVSALIRLKQVADRPQDRIDIDKLRKLHPES
jgi:hypothetical protein